MEILGLHNKPKAKAYLGQNADGHERRRIRRICTNCNIKEHATLYDSQDKQQFSR
jgi:hypothetical protein